MQILAVTTSSNNCSVAILKEKKEIKELNIENEKTHSENLMPLIEQTLKESNTNLKEIDYLACDVGPGSFTGIRIGIATIKAISEVCKIPICAVSSLEGLAYINQQSKNYTVSLIDARNEQAYCGIFNSDYSINRDFFADTIQNIIDILKQKEEHINFVGNATNVYYNILKLNFPNAIFFKENRLLGSNIARAAIKKIEENKIYTADNLLPIYLRKSQAERALDIKNARN